VNPHAMYRDLRPIPSAALPESHSSSPIETLCGSTRGMTACDHIQKSSDDGQACQWRRIAGITRACDRIEVVAFDQEGRPPFNALQNFGSAPAPVVYYVFDVMVLAGQNVMREPLDKRRELLEKKVLPKLSEPVRYAAPLDADLPVLIQSVKVHGFEGLVAKRRNSVYESGLRSGAWMKMRVNRGQEFVIGGYTRGTKTFDALVFGYYQDGKLIYAARTRNGFTPVTRAQLFKKFKGLEIHECPFANLPEARSGRWGQGLTKAKMAECVWLKPFLVGQFEFLEWTADNHLRHSKFVALREDKKARDVARE
jgi:ATP-dependent DNA ligase